MAKSVVVKLSESIQTVKGNKVVLSVDVDLEATGKGVSRLSTSPQDAVLSVFVRGGKAAQTLVATFTSTIVQAIGAKGPVPSFDLNAAQLRRLLSENDSDNAVVLTFNSRSFKHPATQTLTFVVRLPEAPPNLALSGNGLGKNVTVADFELGAELTIAGGVESPAFTDVAKVPLRHENVQDDTDSSITDLNIGATAVFPVTPIVQGKSFPPPRSLKLPIGDRAFEILLHPRVKTTLERSSGFVLSTLIANLRQIFSPVFPNINVEQLAVGDARLAQWKQTGSKVHSTSVVNASSPLVDEGHLVPFFQFWVSTARASDLNQQLEPDALGIAETLAETKFYFSSKTGEKRIQEPAHLVLPSFADTYRDAKGDQANTFAANVIAHEVGHALGLMHIKQADSGYSVTSNLGLMSNQFKPTEGAAPLKLKRLRAVHEAVLRHHYR
jgi:hypothetical protein